MAGSCCSLRHASALLSFLACSSTTCASSTTTLDACASVPHLLVDEKADATNMQARKQETGWQDQARGSPEYDTTRLCALTGKPHW